MTLRRLDAELVHRHLADSRQIARTLIESNVVIVNGIVCSKPTRQVNSSDSIIVSEHDHVWVSRGALKLLSALDAFPEVQEQMNGAVVLDAGASTGGFTEVASQWAQKVIAVDVGYGQIAWSVRTNPKVQVIERTHINDLTLETIKTPANVVLADLSFISLTSVLGAFKRLSTSDSTWLLLVKPQFEVGKEAIGKGVVTDPHLHFNSIEKVANACQDIGWAMLGVCASGLKGPKGNQEFFLWLKGDALPKDRLAINEAITSAIEGGSE